MNPRKRALYNRIFDGHFDDLSGRCMHSLHATFIRDEAILTWMICHGFSGKNLNSFLMEFKYSAFQMGKWVLKKIEHEQQSAFVDSGEVKN